MKRKVTHQFCTLLFCVLGLSMFAQTTLINNGSSWSYYDNADQPTNQGNLDWNDNSYDDSLWSSGNAHLGYGDGDEVTALNNSAKTIYLRHQFNVNNPADFGSLSLNLTYDDGAVVYLNGIEVWRVNMPEGAITYDTFSNSTNGDNANASTIIVGNLNAGSNVLAVEVHQQSNTSSDISFDFELLGNEAGQINIVRGPYLQKGTTNSMVIKWRTLIPTESVINYGTLLGNLNQTFSDNNLKTEHEVEITGLTQGTKYYYEVANNNEVLLPQANDLSFVTHPNIGDTQTYTFWALGDAGTANNNQRAVRDAYYNYIGNNGTDGIIFLGDNAYDDGTDTEYQLAIFENMYEDKLKNTIAWSCLGNHDGHSADSNSQTGPYYDIFTFPTAGESGGLASGTEAYYSWDYGNVHFIALDSYESDRSVNGAMYNWALSDIQNTTQDWIVAYWHHPPYSKGSHNSDTESLLIDMRENFLPMLESNGVDLVLSGHSHSYERSYFLNGHYGNSDSFDSGTNTIGANGYGDGRTDGTGAYIKQLTGPDAGKGAVYITAGSSGKKSSGSFDHEAMYYSVSELGSCIIEVNGSSLTVKFIRETGAIDDYFTIDKGCDLEGQACDDGNDCTINDVYDQNCDCVGTVVNGTESGDLVSYIGNLIDNLPGAAGNEYNQLAENDPEFGLWSSIIDNILTEDIATARAIACGLNYQIKEFTDTTSNPNQVYYILEEQSPQTNYWGTYVFSKNPQIGNLVLQAPHSVHDGNTGRQAAYCFRENVGRALFINGTHRCNETDTSPCSGTTKVCGVEGDYKVSDLAHSVISMFQVTTENLFNSIPNSVFIQLHGFEKKISDPYVIMSNGTQVTPTTDYASQLMDALLLEDNTLTFELAHINTDWDRLRGFSNTQGRLINNSNDHCSENATTPSGRFIHIEQEDTKLRDDEAGWLKMSNALHAVFSSNCETDTDNDGVCDEDDICPGFDDNIDTDGDNIPDGCDTCDVNLVGTPCDDGDPCTTGEVYDEDCNCNGGVFVDNDNDGLCAQDDPDDNDGCNPDPNSGACNPCDALFSDDFENGLGNWISGGSDAYLTMANANSGDYSVRIQDDSGVESSIYTNVLDLSAYDLLRFSFSFYPVAMETGEDFIFEISTDGGNSFAEYQSWTRGTDFNNGERYNVVLNNLNTPITNTMVFRLRCDASYDTDEIYIDDIVISDCPIDCTEGTACDDGDPCTINDTYNEDCDCVGTMQPDSDGDGICDDEDVCPNFDDNLIGTPCDDGDACTENDTYQEDCNCAGTYVDNDGDGLCVGDDPDDNDACNPNPNAGNCIPCNVIITDSFENGYGNWNDGGSDAARVTSNAYTGSYSVRLRDNSSSSNIETDNLDLSNYNQVTVDFTYYPRSMENGEDFFLEISTDGGNNFTIYKSWERGVDFENDIRYFESVVIDDVQLTNTTRFRFRCDATSNSDMVYLDDIEIEACNINQQAKQASVKTSNVQNEIKISTNIKVYPNPAKSILYIECTSLKQSEAIIELYTISGKRVRTIHLKGNYNNTQSIDLKGLNSGLYILRISNEKGKLIKTQRIIIE